MKTIKRHTLYSTLALALTICAGPASLVLCSKPVRAESDKVALAESKSATESRINRARPSLGPNAGSGQDICDGRLILAKASRCQNQ